MMARKESRLGVPVAVTPPDRGSDRYRKSLETKTFAIKEVLVSDEFSTKNGYSMDFILPKQWQGFYWLPQEKPVSKRPV